MGSCCSSPLAACQHDDSDIHTENQNETAALPRHTTSPGMPTAAPHGTEPAAKVSLLVDLAPVPNPPSNLAAGTAIMVPQPIADDGLPPFWTRTDNSNSSDVVEGEIEIYTRPSGSCQGPQLDNCHYELPLSSMLQIACTFLAAHSVAI
jgi:hypothetical protein